MLTRTTSGAPNPLPLDSTTSPYSKPRPTEDYPLSSNTTLTDAPLIPKPQTPNVRPSERLANGSVPDAIIRTVLAHLHAAGETEALRACTLVCRRLLPHARRFVHRDVVLRSSAATVGRVREMIEVVKANTGTYKFEDGGLGANDSMEKLTSSVELGAEREVGDGEVAEGGGIGTMFEAVERLTLDLDDGHRWIFSAILSPDFRTSDPRYYDTLRARRREVDRLLARVLLHISGGITWPAIVEVGTPHRRLRELVLSHYTFYPVSDSSSSSGGDAEFMRGWRSLFGMETLETLRMSDVADFPLALLGSAGRGLQELQLLRVKLDRRDTKHLWGSSRSSSSAVGDGDGVAIGMVGGEGRVKTLRPRRLSVLDCYAETIEPLVACALNPGGFLDLGGVEALSVHPCLALQAPAFDRLVKTVIVQSDLVLEKFVWMASVQHHVKDMDLLVGHHGMFKKVELVFTDGFGGFPRLLREIRDLLGGSSHPPDQAVQPRFLMPALEELTFRFDLENLTMQSTPEATRSTVLADTVEPAGGMPQCRSYDDRHALHPPTKGLYYAHIKYVWKLDEEDMGVLRDIDAMLAGPPPPEDSVVAASRGGELGFGYLEVPRAVVPSLERKTDGDKPPKSPFISSPAAFQGKFERFASTREKGKGEGHRFPNFKRLTTVCVYNKASSYMLDGEKATEVYHACRSFVEGGLPELARRGKLHFLYEEV